MTRSVARWNRSLRVSVRYLTDLAMLPVFLLLVLVLPGRRQRIFWGPVPILNNKYWSAAVRTLGYESETLVTRPYAINDRSDFDSVIEELAGPLARVALLGYAVSRVRAFARILRHARLLQIPFSGGLLGATPYWRIEAYIYKWRRICTVVIPYGADAHQYSRITYTLARQGLIASYPQAGRDEPNVTKRIQYWNRHANCVICGPIIHGMARWDVVTPSCLTIDVERFSSRTSYGLADGQSGCVRIAHAPNHRGFKGTEFVVEAIRLLREEGLEVELVLLEGIPNTKVIEILPSCDILVEQLLAGGYALNAVEGMACGLPVLANLEDEARSRLFRTFAFLGECPIASATPQSVTQVLRRLVRDPQLREQLGRSGRAYVEKYHSRETATYLFGAVYRRVLRGEDVDLMNLFHPLKSEYVRSRPRVVHPLIESRLPPNQAPRC